MIELQTSLDGLRAGQARVEQAAGRIAGSVAEPAPKAAPEDRVSLSREAVELLRGEHQVAVNAAVIKRLGDMDASVLDILA